jgi:hypothetical protein
MKSGLPLKMDRSVPFVEAIFRLIRGSGTEAEAVEILSSAESQTGVALSSKQPSQSCEEVPGERYQEIVEPRMNDFLNRTNLVLGSADYDRLHIIIAEQFTYSWTHREWGHAMAKWANNTGWLDSHDWNYLDFYGGLNERAVEDYNAWCVAAMRVIEIKSNTTNSHG